MAKPERDDEPAAAGEDAAEGRKNGDDRLVCVTGAAGYVGSHVVRQLLEQGYRVRAVVRDAGDRGKTQHLQALGTEHGLRLELASADLLRPGSYDDAVSGCVGVFHAASSVRLTAKDPQREIVDPAVKGTENVLAACRRAGTVERVVLTSSVAAVADATRPESYTFTEADWNEHATMKQPYLLAKTRAERFAWDFQHQLTDEERFELVAVNPSYVLGPVLAKVHLKSSPAIIRDLLRRSTPACPPIYFNVVDVRDLALAQVRAFENPDAEGRYLLSHQGRWIREMAEILAARYPDYPIPTWQLPKAAMYVAALFDKRLSLDYVRRSVGKTERFDASRAPSELDFEYRPIERTILDTAQSLIDGGFVRARNRS